MRMKYIQKIKANITIYANKKTTNLLDGSYQSIYKGKTMNFEDLRTYVMGDDVKDIDWKASARSNSLLVRQYIAEKKHNILLVMDSGKKMLADSEANESKKELALMSAGTIAYLANKNGDFVGAIYNRDEQVAYYPLKSTLYHVEQILYHYDYEVEKTKESFFDKSLAYIIAHMRKRQIIFLITDLEGMDKISEETLKRLTVRNDVLLLQMSDAYMTGNQAYDIEEEKYLPKLVLEDTKLQELERQTRNELQERNKTKFQKYKIPMVTIDTTQNLTNKIIELLERQRNANNR